MSSSPMRLQAGFTQNQSWQPLGLLGTPDPLFYSETYDDFNFYQAGRYTVTNTGNGTVAGTAADGGAILFTTNSSTPATTDISAIQPDNANLVLSTTLKWAFLARVQLADATNSAMNLGLVQKTVTPFTVTDGVYFNKASGNTYLTLSVVSGSTVQASVSLSGLLTMTNGAYYDLGFQYDGKSDLLVYAGQNLVGQKPNQNTATLGPIARISGVGSLTLTTAVLAQTVALQSGTATSKTMQADFFYAAKER